VARADGQPRILLQSTRHVSWEDDSWRHGHHMKPGEGHPGLAELCATDGLPSLSQSDKAGQMDTGTKRRFVQVDGVAHRAGGDLCASLQKAAWPQLITCPQISTNVYRVS
jgi:hypothetical protein